MSEAGGGGERRSIEIEIRVDATPEEAWEAISTSGGMEAWFAPEARVEPGEGGAVWLSWGGGVEGEAPIDAWEPGRRLRWVEAYPSGETDPDSGEPIRVQVGVELTVEGREGSTAVRLVQSGFPPDASWDDYYDALETGWAYFMRHLRHYLEHHRGTPRQMIADRRPPGMTPEEAWRALFGPGGFDVAEVVAGSLAEGDAFTLRLGGRRHPARAWIVKPARALAAVLPDLGDAPLFVEFEGRDEGWHCGVWLSTYGRSEDEVRDLQKAVSEAAAGAFGRAG